MLNKMQAFANDYKCLTIYVQLVEFIICLCFITTEDNLSTASKNREK